MMVPSSWEIYEFQRTLVKNKVSKDNQISASDIKPSGKYPVVDQGQDYIAGYSDEKDKVYILEQPLVIFGDHTRCFKYIDFPFIIGADGTKILAPNTTLFNPKFFYFYLLTLHIQSRGYNRHFKLLREQKILRPPIPEQQNIAHILSKIQSAIEVQEKIIQTTTELKKALMQKLFTEGLKGKRQKETEIGLMPESWEVKVFEDIVTLQRGKDLPKEKFVQGEFPVAGSNGIIGYHNQFNTKAPGVTVGRSGSCGKVVFYEKNFWAHNTALVVKDFNGNNEKFIYYFLCSLKLEKYKSGVSVPTLNRNTFRTIEMAIPKINEQIEIAKILEQTDKKITIAIEKRNILQSLFKSMLHHLMTGQIRVKDLSFYNIFAF